MGFSPPQGEHVDLHCRCARLQTGHPSSGSDRLISIAESRLNASLHEIERRRAVLGETLRRSVKEIEDGEFERIEKTPAQGRKVA
jgi:hypothetical protein